MIISSKLIEVKHNLCGNAMKLLPNRANGGFSGLPLARYKLESN